MATAIGSSRAATDDRSDLDWHRLPVEAVARRLETDPAVGLTDAEAERRLARFGPNELAERGGRGPWRILADQVTGVLTLVLVGAAVLSAFLGDLVDAAAILAIVVLNAALGFSQEHRAERSMAALKRLSAPMVRVRRDGRVGEISSRQLVPGDVVLLEAGAVVPADGRVIRGVQLRLQEAALTGESEAIEKEADLVLAGETSVGDRRNMAYAGTVVAYGRGELLVTATGMATELGKIAGLLQGVPEEQTPLQARLDRLGRGLAAAALVVVVVVFALGLLRGEDWRQMLLAAVSLAVAAIPEALTAVVTIALSLGAQRMLQRRALVRQLPAVETLGSVGVICSDKTGTLTQNRMSVTILDVANHRAEFVQRPGSARLDLVPVDGQRIHAGAQPAIDLLLVAGALANDALLQRDDDPPGYRAIGDPTEAALVLAAAHVGIFKDELDRAFPRVAEVPFDSERKRMATAHRVPRAPEEIPASLRPIWARRAGGPPPPFFVAAKGGLGGMLEIATGVFIEGRTEPLDAGWRERFVAAHDDLAGKGMRVLAVGVGALDRPPSGAPAELERELILVGLAGLMDPPRPEAREAVLTCEAAGIRPVMITGDHPLTARYVAREVGIADDDRFLIGRDLDRLSEAELRRAAREVSVFARVSPEHKIRLVEAYQREGHVVAMTGDGVNDAPALRQADIGVAMGIAGTDVAKEASRMILLDDNFATIVAAVREGRVVYDNIRRFIRYLLTANASEIAVMLFGPLLGMPLPLLPLQILWINLVTDGAPALALGVEPAEADVMRRPPQPASESIFGRGLVPFVVVIGVVTSLVALGVGLLAFHGGDRGWQTLLFTTLVFSQLAVALAVRSDTRPVWRLGLRSNPAMLGAVLLTVALQVAVVYVPALQAVFDTRALPTGGLLAAAGAALLVLVAVELWKWLWRRREGAG